MALTGFKRSMTLTVNKTLAGIMAQGYPKTFRGMDAFTYQATEYPTINSTLLATLPTEAFETRLAAFKKYVEIQEPGLHIDDVCTVPAYISTIPQTETT